MDEERAQGIEFTFFVILEMIGRSREGVDLVFKPSAAIGIIV